MAVVPGGWEFVAYQLDAEQRMLGYRYASRDDWNNEATNKLAQLLFSAGVADVRELALYIGTERVPVPRPSCAGFGGEDAAWQQAQCEAQNAALPTHAERPIAYLYNKRTNAKVSAVGNVPDACWQVNDGDTGNVWTECPPIPALEGPIDYQQVFLPDRHRVKFSVRFIGPDAVAVFIPHLWQAESGWESFGKALAMFVGIASFVIPGLGPAIGAYVFGAQFAAAYPAIVSIATNTAFNAVLGGADIEHAVARALASYAGAEFGQIAGAQFDSQLVGRLTAAATTATLNGQDIGQAVGVALLRAGASGAISIDTPAAPAQPSGGSMFVDSDTTFEPIDDWSGDPMFATGTTVDVGTFDYLGAPADDFIDLGGDPMFGGGSVDLSGDPMFSDTGYSTDQPLLTGGLDEGSGWSWDDALAKVTQAALVALQINKVYQASKSPAPRAAPPSQVVNKNGTITTRSPTGTLSTARPAVGQPVVAADGTIIMNNGDGTYTTILPNGAQSTNRYPVAGSGSSVGGLLGQVDTRTLVAIGAAGLGLLLLLRKR